MERFVRAFLKASVTWLAIGVTLGVAMIAVPSWIVYRPAHLHMNLLGFVAMMIFGVGYHVIPRFSGAPLYNRRLAAVHWWMSNLGLILLASGFVVRPMALKWPIAAAMLAVGGTLSALGAYAFVYNVWRTLDSGPMRTRHRIVTSDAPVVPVTRRN